MRDYYDEQTEPVPGWLHYAASVAATFGIVALMVLMMWVIFGG